MRSTVGYLRRRRRQDEKRTHGPGGKVPEGQAYSQANGEPAAEPEPRSVAGEPPSRPARIEEPGND